MQLPSGATIVDVLRHLTGPGDEEAPRPTGMAVALGDDVVPAGQWTTTRLRTGDRLEVLGAVAGG
nr:sulfur carrier protein ThiS [Kineosporia mesophila]